MFYEVQAKAIQVLFPPSAHKLDFSLKGQGHVTVNKPVISRISIVAHTWPLCSAQISVDGVNSH